MRIDPTNQVLQEILKILRLIFFKKGNLKKIFLCMLIRKKNGGTILLFDILIDIWLRFFASYLSTLCNLYYYYYYDYLIWYCLWLLNILDGDDGSYLITTCSLEAEHFPQHMSCSKQYCHLHTPNDVVFPRHPA